MELTVESLIGELGLELISGRESAQTHVRWVHSSELVDPTPWLKGGELLLTTGIQLRGRKAQRELTSSGSPTTDIAGLGFGTGFRHRRLPAALVTAAATAAASRCSRFPTSCRSSRSPSARSRSLLDERYEMLQRNMAATCSRRRSAVTSTRRTCRHGCGPFGIGERSRCWRSRSRTRAPRRRCRAPARGRATSAAWSRSAGSALRGHRCRRGSKRRGARPGRARGADPERAGARYGEVRAAASRAGSDAFAADELPRGALRARGGAAPQRQLAGGRHLRGPGRLPAAALAAGRGGAQLLLPQRARADGAGRGRLRGRAGRARSTCSSSTTGTGRRRPPSCTATATRCATASAASSSSPAADFSSARDRIEFWLALRGRELAR